MADRSHVTPPYQQHQHEHRQADYCSRSKEICPAVGIDEFARIAGDELGQQQHHRGEKRVLGRRIGLIHETRQVSDKGR